MAKITIEYSVPQSKFDAVVEGAKALSAHDPNCNGMEFEVERGDFTCVESGDEILNAALFQAIKDLIDN